MKKTTLEYVEQKICVMDDILCDPKTQPIVRVVISVGVAAVIGGVQMVCMVNRIRKGVGRVLIKLSK